MDTNTRKTVMVIEDEKLLLEAVALKLQAAGFATILCNSAEEAISELHKGTLPNLIWLDYYLPDMNGLEFMTSVNKNASWKSIPVIVVSNSASEERKKAMLDAGVKRYLLKAQYKISDIITIVREIIDGEKKTVDSQNVT